MKKITFLMLMAAAALTSCNSNDPLADLNQEETALSRAIEPRAIVNVSTQEEFIAACANESATIIRLVNNLTLTKDVEITHKASIRPLNVGYKITSTHSILCKSNVTFTGIMIDATTPRGSGALVIAADGITVVLNSSTIRQNTAGQGDASHAAAGIGIDFNKGNAVCPDNVTLELNNSTIEMGAVSQRGISLNGDNSSSTTTTVKLTNSKVTSYNFENDPTPLTYARGIQVYGMNGKTEVILDNSQVRGAYYQLNVGGNCEDLTFTVENGSVLDGRAAFNIWSPNVKANITGSKLVGRNIYTGSTENFATIVMNEDAKGGVFNIGYSTFEMYRPLAHDTNHQYAFSMRSSDQKVTFSGTVKIVDRSKSMPYFIDIKDGVTGYTFNGTTYVDISGNAPGATLFKN